MSKVCVGGELLAPANVRCVPGRGTDLSLYVPSARKEHVYVCTNSTASSSATSRSQLPTPSSCLPVSPLPSAMLPSPTSVAVPWWRSSPDAADYPQTWSQCGSYLLSSSSAPSTPYSLSRARRSSAPWHPHSLSGPSAPHLHSPAPALCAPWPPSWPPAID